MELSTAKWKYKYEDPSTDLNRLKNKIRLDIGVSVKPLMYIVTDWIAVPVNFH